MARGKIWVHRYTKEQCQLIITPLQLLCAVLAMGAINNGSDVQFAY